MDIVRVLTLYARHHSWLNLAGRLYKTVVRPIYESNERAIVWLSCDDVANSEQAVDVVERTHEHIDQLLDIMYVSREGILARFDRGERCFAVLQDDRVISFFWSQVGLKDWDEMDLQFNLPANQGWMYNGITIKPARGRGLYPNIIRHMVKMLRQEGIQEYYVDVKPKNRASVRGLEKAGFTKIAIVAMRKVFSKTTYHVKVFDKSRWEPLAKLIVNFDRKQWTVTEEPHHDGCTNTRQD